MASTIAWYSDAGFAVRDQEQHGSRWCQVERDGLVLQFLAGDTPWDGPPALTGCFYVHVSDVDGVADMLPDSIEAPWGVEERDWGSRELVLRDPNGYFVTFTGPTTSPD